MGRVVFCYCNRCPTTPLLLAGLWGGHDLLSEGFCYCTERRIGEALIQCDSNPTAVLRLVDFPSRRDSCSPCTCTCTNQST